MERCQARPPLKSRLFLSKARKRLRDLEPEDCRDAQTFFCLLYTSTPNGYWKIWVVTPNDQIHHHLYIGISKKEALRRARTTDFDRAAGLIFNEPSR